MSKASQNQLSAAHLQQETPVTTNTTVTTTTSSKTTDTTLSRYEEAAIELSRSRIQQESLAYKVDQYLYHIMVVDPVFVPVTKE